MINNYFKVRGVSFFFDDASKTDTDRAFISAQELANSFASQGKWPRISVFRQTLPERTQHVVGEALYPVAEAVQ
jgi:hypothetical protein